MAGKKPNKPFNISDIGSGSYYTAGSFTSSKRKGLAGALRKAKYEGSQTYKNLSTENLKTFQGIIGKELSKIGKHSSGLNRLARMRIMAEAEKLRRQGKISAEDKHDLRSIVSALGPKEAQKIQQSAQEKAAAAQKERFTKHLIAYHQMEAADEIAQEEAGNIAIPYDPRGILGQTQPKKSQGRGLGSRRIELHDPKRLPGPPSQKK